MQNQVILSIGSNQGERLENMEQSIKMIHQNVGTVIQVSGVYETPSWGFESAPFYNCVLLLHTEKTAQKVLSSVLKIEKKLGRIRKVSDNYEARKIDIDIISRQTGKNKIG